MLIRNWLSNLSRVFFLALAFLVLLGGSTFVIALLVSWFVDVSVMDAPALYSGLVSGLVIWLLVASINLRRATLRVPFQDSDPVMKKVEAVLTELGYEHHGDATSGQWYKPSFRSYLLGGQVKMAVDDNCVLVTAPRFCVALLRRYLRVRSHLDNVQQAIQESRRRQGERLLSRVQLTLRVPSSLWTEIAHYVIKPLEREGAVVCQLDILAQNDAGIRDHVVEHQVRSWLASQGIEAQINKDTMVRKDSVRKTPALALHGTVSV